MATAQQRLAAGESVPVAELLAELTAPYPRTNVFVKWYEQRDLPPVVMVRVAQLLRAIERTMPEALQSLLEGLECNQPGISGGLAEYRGD